MFTPPPIVARLKTLRHVGHRGVRLADYERMLISQLLGVQTRDRRSNSLEKMSRWKKDDQGWQKVTSFVAPGPILNSIVSGEQTHHHIVTRIRIFFTVCFRSMVAVDIVLCP